MNGFMYRPYGDLIPNCFCGHQPDPVSSARDQAWTRHDVGHFPFAGISEIPEEMMQDAIVTREALSCIEDHAAGNPGQPWFVCASYQRPHHPFTAPKRHFDRYWPDGPSLEPLPEGFPDALHPHDRFIVGDFRLTEFSEEERRKCLAAYYASVSFLDECIGALLDGLERSGQLENTIIVYTSDHGDMMSEHGLWWKRSYYDGSAAVPLLIRPGVPMSSPASVPDIVELLDLFPTLCDLSGLPHPDGLEGESLIRERTRDFARSQHIARPETTFRMIRTLRWKYVEFPEYPPVLFDMVSDPGEERNIAHLPEYDTVVDDLQRRLWEDGESFERLMSARQEDRRRMRNEFPVRCDRTPNQLALPTGELVDAERSLYEPYLRKDE
jgi:choline-sulfatase